MTQSVSTDTSRNSVFREVFGVVADAQSYKNIAYLVLAFPLGLFYFVVLTVGLSLGLGLSVLLIGLVILLVTVIGLRTIAAFERHLANSLLDVHIPDPDDVDVRGDGIVETGKAYVRASSTWRGLGFVFLKFWVGILSFVLLVSFLGTGVDLILAPVVPDGAFNVQINGWYPARAADTPAEQAISVIGGLALALLAMHLINAFARVTAQMAAALLGPDDSDSGAVNTR